MGAEGHRQHHRIGRSRGGVAVDVYAALLMPLDNEAGLERPTGLPVEHPPGADDPRPVPAMLAGHVVGASPAGAEGLPLRPLVAAMLVRNGGIDVGGFRAALVAYQASQTPYLRQQ